MAEGKTSSAELTDACLKRIADPAGEGKRAFLRTWDREARAVATTQDLLRPRGYAVSPLAGIPVSIKDLFDVRGEITLAGTTALEDSAAAMFDAPVVARLKAAGAVLVGRTNMTQFAFSAVGINPHFGTPGNPWDRTRIPGGSSSGAAVSVADEMATAAIGSDTVGSIRVPAALCGVVGFKPTQNRVSRQGAVPLSTTLDTIGPLARSVEDCGLVFAAIADEEPKLFPCFNLQGLRLAIPTNVVLDDLDDEVSKAFERFCSSISRAGAVVSEVELQLLSEIQATRVNATIQSVEALAWHEQLLSRKGDEYDPKVRARIERGAQVSAIDYARALSQRAHQIEKFSELTSHFDALIMPTVPVIAPTIEECVRDEDAIRAKLIRNPSLFNFFDCPAISIPIHDRGRPPVGLMVVGGRDEDWRLLNVARAIEAWLDSEQG